MPAYVQCAPQTGSFKTFSSVYASRFAASFFGLAAVRIWIQCCFYGRYTAADAGALTIVGNVTRVVLIVLLMIAFARGHFGAHAQKALDYLSVSFMTGAALLYLVQTEMPNAMLPVVGSVLAGIGIVWGGGMWMRFYDRLEPGEALVYTFSCLAISSVLGFFVGLAPAVLAYAICAFMPVVSYVAYVQAMALLDARKTVLPEPCTDVVYDGEPKSTVMRILAGIALLGFSVGVARGFPHGVSIALSVPFQALHQFGVCALCIGLVWWALVKGRAMRFGTLWRLIIAFVIAGMVLIPLDNEIALELGALCITTANTFLVGYLWFIAYDYGRHSSLPSYVVLGAIWVAHVLPREIGRWLIYAFGQYAETTVIPISLMICLVVLGTGLLLSDRLPRSRPMFSDFDGATLQAGLESRIAGSASSAETALVEKGQGEGHGLSSREGEATPARVSDLEARCRSVQKAYGLTDRERDMVYLLAQGRSKSYISKFLFISENTVKGYTRNAYAKLGVHSKQELLDIVEGQRPSSKANG